MNASRALVTLFAILSLQSHADEGWLIRAGTSMSVEGTVQDPKDISGAASYVGGSGVLVSDETRVVQPFRCNLPDEKIIIGEPVNLLASDGKEFDLEAITAAQESACYYATGSHGVARKSGKVQADRQHVFRLPIEPSLGKIKPESITVTTLLPVLKSEPLLKDAIGKSSDEGGLDIEGLAEHDGTLFFGLRSPNLGGKAFIIEVPASELFANAETATHRTHQLAIGKGIGIRDIAAIRDGFLLIAGRAGNDESVSGFTLHQWAGPGGKLTKIGELPAAAGKAEALLVADESEAEVTVVIFYDGVTNGVPMSLRIIKPGPSEPLAKPLR
ncbi:MAG: DUF3616 domain-containing protein [Prosthecobacter sp.]|uniref:DUF3616 domain-containing protein n=1 Tax=Prosthecobacter sp. TaxID=1965333 RepID=UPI003903951E